MKPGFNSPEYKRYQKAYVTQCTLEHLLGILVLDAFLAKLLSYIGLSDALVGIVSSFTSVAFLFQLFSIGLVQSKLSTKKIVVTADVISQLAFMLIYFVPFIPLPDTAKKLLVAGCVMLGQVGKTVISSLYFKWANTYVDPDKRATFSARKECISLIVGIVFSAVMGMIIDKFESIGNIKGGFLFIATAMLIINIANFISFMLIKDESPEARASMRVPTKEVIQHIFSNKIFFRYIVYGFLFSIAGGLTGGFIGIYKTKDLAFSVLTIQIVNIIADFLRMGVSMPIARYSNKYGFMRGIQLAEFMTLFGYLIIVFTSPATRWLIIPYTLLTTASQAASYQNSFNIGYTLLPEKYMAQGMAIKRTLSGLVSFLFSLVGGHILNMVQANGNTILGIPMYAQQFLALISVTLYIPAILLQYKFILEPLDEKLKAKE